MVSIMLKTKGYNYGNNIWLHDAKARDRSVITFVDQARQLGINGIVLEPHSLLHGINMVKTTLHWLRMRMRKLHSRRSIFRHACLYGLQKKDIVINGKNANRISRTSS